jgi:hypothetical protein
VGCGGANGAVNRGWEAAEAANDGGQELRRSSGERGARKEGREVEWACMSARASPWGAQGRASSQGGDTASESCCWQAGGRMALGTTAARRGAARRGPAQVG